MERRLWLCLRRYVFVQIKIECSCNQRSKCSFICKQGGLARSIDTSGADANADEGLKLEGDSRSDAFKVDDKDDDGLDEVLDEDGKPYFEPLEMNRLCKKYADLLGDDLTEKNGIHGFWR